MINESELEQIVGIYGVANTPIYLYRHLQAHPAVSRLAENESSADLLTRVQSVATGARSIRDLAEAYANIVAILLRDNLRRESTPKELADVTGIDWLSALLSWHAAKSVATTSTTVIVPQQAASEAPVLSASTTNSPLQLLETSK